MTELKPCPFCGGRADHQNDTGPRDEYLEEWYSCNVCGARADDAKSWNTRVSPWRSLESDPPEPPTEETNHALLVRSSPLDRDLDDDRYRLLVPYQDRDNGNRWRWFESHLDYVLEDVIDGGYSEWMEVPK